MFKHQEALASGLSLASSSLSSSRLTVRRCPSGADAKHARNQLSLVMMAFESSPSMSLHQLC
ncbi:hypothetical protein PCASD_16144 [Puccinia coronata f. sp. avenae]|uniref:Uncharacterized protein n=1 Tax=Puccinia coronata f. sp. avenae TaxID=200324 RepID=A0A2N5TAS4_9BASI|nr:hypothetical protein PCASD_16144 [Puccinia coronata f. sp. avenae]